MLIFEKWRRTAVPAFTFMLLMFCAACSKNQLRDSGRRELRTEVLLSLDAGQYLSKAADSDEEAVNDANIFIYDEFDLLEEHLWVSFKDRAQTCVSLAVGKTYSFYVIANAGFRMKDSSLSELLKMKFYLSAPDACSHGIVMAGYATGVQTGSLQTICDEDDGEDGSGGAKAAVSITLERLMCKLSLRINRSQLTEDVSFNVRSVRVGNCPRCVHPFDSQRITSTDELFAVGFHKDGDQCADLNWSDGSGCSRSVSVFLLENPADALDKALCPYIEMESDYLSDYWHSSSEKGLIYRFYLRENDSYRIERNCHYKVSVRPEKDGLLCEDSWRVDKSGLSARDGDYHMKIVPDGSLIEGTYYPFYYEMDRDGSLHFELDLFPSDMTVKLSEDFVEDELLEGRAAWSMDSDGKGFSVKALGKACMSTMVIVPGAPLSEEEAETIVVKIR